MVGVKLSGQTPKCLQLVGSQQAKTAMAYKRYGLTVRGHRVFSWSSVLVIHVLLFFGSLSFYAIASDNHELAIGRNAASNKGQVREVQPQGGHWRFRGSVLLQTIMLAENLRDSGRLKDTILRCLRCLSSLSCSLSKKTWASMKALLVNIA